jgi:hypothetical protein
MGLHEIKKLHNKRNGLQTEEITHRVGENIHWLYIRQRTDNWSAQGPQKTKLPKINEPTKKWATELNRMFSKKEIQMTKKKHTHEKMLTIPGHKRNANQNHTKIPPHSY